MKVGQGKKWTFSPSDVATESGSVFESLSAPQSEDALVSDVTSSDDVLVESEKGGIFNLFFRSRKETIKLLFFRRR